MTNHKKRAMEDERAERSQLWAVSARGRRHPFLRGMITHDLVQRGLSFEDGYTVARAIRGRLADRSEVATSEIRDLIETEVEAMFGIDIVHELRTPRTQPEVRVVYQGQEHPFSRGLLARSISAADIDLDRAYTLVAELQATLRQEDIRELSSGEVARRVDELIEQREGTTAARRYRLARRARHLSKPLVIYLGGVTGTGKSTLALELAPLLRIYRINATDTIRQVMRMVFTPAMLPALHASSFELASNDLMVTGEVHGTPEDPEFAERLIRSFKEQATRVCVGVRAVVERASVEMMNIIVEGVHLHPNIIPFPDLEESVYQVPLFLSTQDPETHRSRFLQSSRADRGPEHYIEHFSAIRLMHDQLMQLVESRALPLIDTSDEHPPIGTMLRVVTSILEKQVPSMAVTASSTTNVVPPTLMVIIDGMTDRPVRALANRTPLQAATTPALDRLAREGLNGLAYAVAPHVVPDTAAGSLALFGQAPQALKRGPVEALGAGIRLGPGDVALRANLATVDDDGIVIDRRAGRIRAEAAELAKAIDGIHLSGVNDAEVTVRAATEHRLAIVLRGDELSSAIEGSDPGEGAGPSAPLTPRALDANNERAMRTARVLEELEHAAAEALSVHPANLARSRAGLPPANRILTRGAGRIHRLVPLEHDGRPLKLTCVGGDRTVLGICEWLDAETVSSPEMTANLDTDIAAKFAAARRVLSSSDLVFVHLKGADIASHDRRPDLKVRFLEKIDGQLASLLDAWSGPLRIAVVSDHATLSESGQHAADPIPVVIWGDGIEPDEVVTFNEISAARGQMKRFQLQKLLARLFDLS